jgi:transcriptional regulator with XRE-family HTH domain
MVKFTSSDKFHPEAMAVEIATFCNGRMVPKRQIPPKRQFRRTFIREWRKYRELTLEQLADRLEMTASHFSMLERGQRGYTQETLEAIAGALRTDAASLLMRNPMDDEAIWSIWDDAKTADRQKIVAIARTITGKTGTDN